MTVVRIYDAVVRYAADLDTAITAADTAGALDPNTGRASADDLARDLAELAADYLAAGEPPVTFFFVAPQWGSRPPVRHDCSPLQFS
ncbi:hypothetical protein [Kitasatospora sp. NPDC094011]|uniref:hypothetical protein n=1 Tax=Kitasatospora sp. NPDC094011 TaxID=3364090 RepID=UPI0038309C0E